MKFYPIILLVFFISGSLFYSSCKSNNEYFSKALEILETLDQNGEPDYQAAIDFLNKSIEQDSSFINAYYWKSNCEMKLKYYQNTIETSAIGLRHSKKSNDKLVPYFYINQGVAFLKMENQEEAHECFLQAVEVFDYRLKKDEDDLDAIINKATALCYADMKDEALIFIDSKIKARPNEVTLKQLYKNTESFDLSQIINQL